MGKRQIGRQEKITSRLSVGFVTAAALLQVLVACGPRQNAFQLNEAEHVALPGGDIDPTMFDREDGPVVSQPPAETQDRHPKRAEPPVRDTNVTPEGREAVAPTGPTKSFEGPADTAVATVPADPPDRDESKLDQIRTRVTPGGLFDSTGRPRRDYSARLKDRFGDRLNTPVTSDKISAGDLEKSRKIFLEIQRAVDRRTGLKDSALMFMASAEAIATAKNFESTGEIAKAGAWTIATEGTAKRHGFGNVPCAEFMSEVIRQAYARAGYRLVDDFNDKSGNSLIWTTTASVTGLSKALFKAGWVPFAAHQFRPPVGAIMFHTVGLSPSHTYAAAGMDGMLIVDNGAPKGRDLRQTKLKTLNLMFHSGFFMLPPGITPQKWPDPSVPTS